MEFMTKRLPNENLYWYNSGCCLVIKACLTLCSPMNCSSPGSSDMGFSRQEYWSGLPCPAPGGIPIQGLNLCLVHLLHWQADSLLLVSLGRLCQSFSKCESKSQIPSHPQDNWFGREVITNELSCITNATVKQCSHFGKRVWQFLEMLNTVKSKEFHSQLCTQENEYVCPHKSLYVNVHNDS